MNSDTDNRRRPSKLWLARQNFSLLFEALGSLGYKIIAPVIRNGAILFDSVTSPGELACGVRERQAPGKYSLDSDSSGHFFSWNTGLQGLKPLLFKPEQTLWSCRAEDSGLSFHQAPLGAEKIAVIGVRACDLAALALQDKHFLFGPYQDEFYKAQREKLLLVAVNCSASGEQCFCVSTGTGPEAKFYYDLVLDELDDGFLLEQGSDKGLAVLDALSLEPASAERCAMAKVQVNAAAKNQNKQMPDERKLQQLTELLADRHWESIAERCLSCGNCTLVCPTCFCSKQESKRHLFPDAEGGVISEQVRLWDSCFSVEHSHIFGKNFRPTISSRYRQWVTHKLANWQSQYGRSGCVGCGRCITWCPAAIDLVEEVQDLLKQLPDSEHEKAGGGKEQHYE
ncbi:4Fe-4S dicluster domain-containing protein [Vibrio hannami]|uniref:4Fe-4S dicluster domain-containing protein n=1 Tax=Vibrio hannami TaxID=2717094 RepID=UPI0024106E18|nr:4Fe-4S dicluster domain-containing protein [Vibrio hannami]MDG3088536.1 4Fe-4S dicluster domain-containing protein [Vibrio hannami]